jgi:Fe-S-cluster containining protein
LTGRVDALRRGCDAAACVAVCRRTIGVVDSEFAARRAEGAAIACAPGCTFCCHQRVGVYAHEAVALLSRLRALQSRADATAIEARILANARAIDGMTVERHRAANLACAFLVDSRCAAYDARPLACARYHSLSRARCERAFEHPEDIGTPRNARPALAELQAFGNAVADATEATLGEAGLSSAKGELHQLLRALLENPDLSERWSASEDITAISADAEHSGLAGDCHMPGRSGRIRPLG